MRQEIVDKPIFSSVPDLLRESLVQLAKVPELIPVHRKFPTPLPERIENILLRWLSLPDNRKEAYESLLAQLKPTPLLELSPTILAKNERERPPRNNFALIYWPMFLEKELRRPSRSNYPPSYCQPDITPVIECSTGNAGRAFAWTARELGFRDYTVITHADTSPRRIENIKNLGARVIFSPAGQYAKGYAEKLERDLREDKHQKREDGISIEYWTEAAVKIDPLAQVGYLIYAKEFFGQLREQYGSEAIIRKFICVLGSGTTCSGIGLWIKAEDPSVEIVPVEPNYCPAISTLLRTGYPLQYDRTPHVTLGTGAWGLPLDKLDINPKIINPDNIIQVSEEEIRTGLNTLHSAGYLVGLSSGMELAAARKTGGDGLAMTLHDDFEQYVGIPVK